MSSDPLRALELEAAALREALEEARDRITALEQKNEALRLTLRAQARSARAFAERRRDTGDG